MVSGRPTHNSKVSLADRAAGGGEGQEILQTFQGQLLADAVKFKGSRHGSLAQVGLQKPHILRQTKLSPPEGREHGLGEIRAGSALARIMDSRLLFCPFLTLVSARRT